MPQVVSRRSRQEPVCGKPRFHGLWLLRQFWKAASRLAPPLCLGDPGSSQSSVRSLSLAKPLGAVTNNGTPSPHNPAAARTLGGPRRPSWPPALRILSSRQHQDRLRGPRSTESCRETRAPSRRRRTALGTAPGTSTDNQSPAGRNFRRAGRHGAAQLGAWEETTSLICKAESGLACQPPVQSRDARLSYIPHSRLFPRPQGTMTHIRMSLFGFNEL